MGFPALHYYLRPSIYRPKKAEEEVQNDEGSSSNVTDQQSNEAIVFDDPNDAQSAQCYKKSLSHGK